MRTPWGVTLTALLLWLMTPGATVRALDNLSLGIPGNAPFTGLEGTRISGVIAEATVRALATMGHTVTPRPLPFKRMYQWIHTGHLDVAVSVLSTPERRSLAHYSAPIVTEYTLLMVPRGGAFPFQRLADLQAKKIGGQLGFSYPQLDTLGIELIRENDYVTNLRKLVAGKIDGILIGSITGPFLAKRLGLLERLEILPQAIEAVPLGAALSKTTFTEADLEGFNLAVKALQASPIWQQILAANGVAELMQVWPVVRD